MKILTILASICVAFAAVTAHVEPVKLPCCPNPPLRFGIGPACRQCNEPTQPKLPCCPDPPLNPKFGPGPVCRPC